MVTKAEKARLIADQRHTEYGISNSSYNNLSKDQEQNLKPIFQRWVVVDVIFDPFIVDNKKLEFYNQKYSDIPIANLDYVKGIELPRNSILARKVIDLSQGNPEGYGTLMFLYPFFPSHLSLPCKPGEHVWVMFEHLTRSDIIGYWVCGIVGQGNIDDVNHTHHPRDFDSSFNSQPVAGEIHEETTISPRYHFKSGMYFPSEQNFYERILTESEATFASVYESVPRFKKRPGDIALEGTNNTLIVLGRDRNGQGVEYSTVNVTDENNQTQNVVKNVVNDPTALFKKRNAGSIDIVAGRGQTTTTSGRKIINDLQNLELAKDKTSTNENPNEGDTDFINDRSRIYVSQNTLVDTNLKLSEHNTKMEINDDLQNGDPSIIIKSDKIRIFARSDVQILVSGFTPQTNATTSTIEAPEGLEFLENELKSEFKDTIKNENKSETNWASITIKSNGDIIFKPSAQGYIKLGDETADKAILCTDFPAVQNNGLVSVNTPYLLTNGADSIGTGAPGQGTFSTKVLVK